MKKVCMLGLVLVSLGRLSLAQDKVFDWVRASDEVSQLDPADYHAGRVYRPGADGGGMRVDIQAKRPVTIAMAFASDGMPGLNIPRVRPTLSCAACVST